MSVMAAHPGDPDPATTPGRAVPRPTSLPLTPWCLSACPRLVAWREAVAAVPRALFAGQTYWGKPVPGFGSPLAES